MSEPRISIIVPVYNAQDTLGRCLDSLLAQTFGDIEVICIDDGSQDASLALLRDRASHEGRLRVQHQENAGVSVARNVGMRLARGQILMFVDADDELVSEACARVSDVFDREHPEVLTFGLRCVPEEATPLSLRRELAPRAITYDGFRPSLLFKEYARPYACRTAVSASFMRRCHIGFEPGLTLGEDQVFYFVVYPLSAKTVLMPDELYLYTMNEQSKTHESQAGRERLLAKLGQHLHMVEAILREWKGRGLAGRWDAELVEWILDLLMLDVSKLPHVDQHRVYARLVADLRSYLGHQDVAACLVRAPSRACALRIEQAAADPSSDNPVFSRLELPIFYLMRRGLVRCLERVWMRARR